MKPQTFSKLSTVKPALKDGVHIDIMIENWSGTNIFTTAEVAEF